MPLEGIAGDTDGGNPFWKVAGVAPSDNTAGPYVRNRGIVRVIRSNRIVERIIVIRKWRVADAESCPDHRGVRQPVSRSESRRRVVVMRSEAQIPGHIAHARNLKCVVRRIVV